MIYFVSSETLTHNSVNYTQRQNTFFYAFGETMPLCPARRTWCGASRGPSASAEPRIPTCSPVCVRYGEIIRCTDGRFEACRLGALVMVGFRRFGLSDIDYSSRDRSAPAENIVSTEHRTSRRENRCMAGLPLGFQEPSRMNPWTLLPLPGELPPLQRCYRITWGETWSCRMAGLPGSLVRSVAGKNWLPRRRSQPRH